VSDEHAGNGGDAATAKEAIGHWRVSEFSRCQSQTRQTKMGLLPRLLRVLLQVNVNRNL